MPWRDTISRLDSSGLLSRLSDRELAVLRAIADGKSNEGCAVALGVSIKTIEAACRSMFQKLELADSPLVNRRVQAARLYIDHGPVPGAERSRSLPQTFVGRVEELRELDRSLRLHRTVTVVGTGGTGKTALAIALSTDRARCGESTWFVDLVPAADRLGVVEALCDSFGVVARNTEGSLHRVQARFGEGRSLIVLDNAEQVTEHTAWLLDKLDLGDRVEVLVTSRSALRYRNEHIWPVPPMSSHDCTELLRSLIATDLDNGTLTALCRSADGLPLALQLLAARVASLSADGVLARLDRLPALLRSGPVGRHASISAALGASYAALSPIEQRLFRALSVFPVGVTMDAVDAFADGRFGDARLSVEALLDVSLMGRTGDRIRMLEPVRQYAAELLDREAETALAERSLIGWACEVADEATLRAQSRDDAGWRGEFSQHLHAVERALEWAIEAGDAAPAWRIGTAISEYRANGEIGHGFELVSRALMLSGDDGPARTDLMLGAGLLAMQLNRPDTADLLNTALDRYRAHGNATGAARAAEALVGHTRRIDHGQLAVALADASGSAVLRAWTRVFSAQALWRHDAPHRDVLALLDEADDIAVRGGSRHGRGGAQLCRAAYRARAGRPTQQVLADLDAAEETFDGLRDHWNLVDCLHQRAALHLRDRNGDAARRPALRGLQLCLTSIDDPIAMCDALFDAAAVLELADRRGAARAAALAATAFNETLSPLWKRVVHDVAHPLIADLPLPNDDTVAVTDLHTAATIAFADLSAF